MRSALTSFKCSACASRASRKRFNCLKQFPKETEADAEREKEGPQILGSPPRATNQATERLRGGRVLFFGYTERTLPRVFGKSRSAQQKNLARFRARAGKRDGDDADGQIFEPDPAEYEQVGEDVASRRILLRVRADYAHESRRISLFPVASFVAPDDGEFSRDVLARKDAVYFRAVSVWWSIRGRGSGISKEARERSRAKPSARGCRVGVHAIIVQSSRCIISARSRKISPKSFCAR